MNDNELVVLAVRGSSEAFCELYDMHKEKLYNFAYYKLGNREDAEDAVQDAVMKAYEQISSLRNENAFQSWLFKILYCSCNHKIKEQIANRNNSDMDSIRNLSSFEDESFILAHELKQALSVLSEKDKNIVLLSVLAGFSSKEIARITGLTSGNVRQRLKRALSKMRCELS